MGQVLRNLGEIWQRIGLVQRVMLVGVLVACLGAAALLVGWARKPHMVLLYSRLDPEEAARIVEKINDADVPYELKEGGTSIYVPQEDCYSLRLTLAGEGLPIGGQAGYQILDTEKMGTSPFMQRVNYVRAIEGELAKTIQTLDGVASARVHVVRPEAAIFSGQKEESSATVVLRIRGHRRLTDSAVAAIVHLVAGGVEDLSPEKVVVVDGAGKLLSSGEAEDKQLPAGTRTLLDYKGRVEQDLTRKAEDLLIAALGPNRACVRVSATVETTTSEQTTKSYDDQNRGTIREDSKSKSSTNGSPPAAGGGGKGGSILKESQENVEYAPGETIEHRVNLPGKVLSLSVAAFVDLTPPEKKEGEEASPAAGAMPSLEDVEEIIRNALGLAQADRLTVKQTSFGRGVALEQPPEEEGIFNKDFILEMARRVSLGVLVIGVLLMLRIFGRAKKKGEVSVPALGGPTAQIGNLLPAEAGGADPALLRARITRALQDNPEEVKRLFLSWIESKQGES